jgi:hypothetical protein
MKHPDYEMTQKTLTNIKNQWEKKEIKCGARICLKKTRAIKLGQLVHRSIGYHRIYHFECWENMLI